MKNLLNTTETVTSVERIKEIFDTLFIERPVYMKYGRKDIRVKCYSCINGRVTAGIPFIKIVPEPAVFFTSVGNRSVNLYLRKVGRGGNDITVFDVIKCVVVVPARSSERYFIPHNKDHRKVAYITDFITDTVIDNSLIFASKKLNSVFSFAENELMKKFSFARFVIRAGATEDARMKYIINRQRGIFLKKPDDDDPEDSEGHEYYMKNIFYREKSAKSSRIPFSEILIPIKYRDKIPYGYLRVNKDSAPAVSECAYAENFARSIEQYILKMDIFPVVSEKLMVHEVSKGGMSVLQHDRKNMRYFKIGNSFCCDLVFPEHDRIHLLSKIRHNSAGADGVIHTGFQIEKIDDSHVRDYNACIESFAHENGGH